MKKNIVRLLFILLISFIFISSGCVGSPEPNNNTSDGESVQSAPDWFFSPPDEDEKYKYFIGSGTSESGNISEAEDNAIRDLMDSIIMFIGVEVDSETTATAKASLDEFSSDISQTVKTKGSARVSGFEVREKLPHKEGEKLTIYLLARYEKKELEKERKRIKEIFQKKYDAVNIPMEKGDESLAAKKYYDAAIKYIEAAGAAATSTIPNADILFKEAIDKAKSAIENINLIKINDNLKGLAGQSFAEPFMVVVAAGTSENDPGIPDIVLEIGYKEMTKQGKLQIRSQKMKTDENGMISFNHPIPNFVGSETVRMSLDMESYLEPLWEVPYQYDEIVDGLGSLIAGKKIVFEYMVDSNAKNIMTGIVILDLDINASSLKKTDTAASLLSTLSSEGFKVKLLSLNPAELNEKSDFDIINVLVAKFSTDVERAIFGTTRVLNFNKRDGKILAKCSGTVQVVDLDTGEILLTVVKSVNAMGTDEAGAQAAGFTRIGNEIGEEIKNKLR
ncbi:MAG: hypothetical protein JXB88_21175 [Spirochaetales bacterium]|nr:hypothetical protein [Spirochaetales bacterium]